MSVQEWNRSGEVDVGGGVAPGGFHFEWITLELPTRHSGGSVPAEPAELLIWGALCRLK